MRIYNRYFYVNKLMADANEQRVEIVNLFVRKRMYYNKILVKIENNKECEILMDLLKNRYIVALYKVDYKEVKLSKDGFFEADVEFIILTSSIQNGQSIMENVLSIFLQTNINSISSVKLFFWS